MIRIHCSCLYINGRIYGQVQHETFNKVAFFENHAPSPHTFGNTSFTPHLTSQKLPLLFNPLKIL